MERAVELASLGPEYGPNPRVGCVIVDSSWLVLGEGFHQGAGTAHAEVAALADARRRGNDVAGATAYVTLEPCAHTGRTGPCAVALIDSGIGAVEYAVEDPNPQASGGASVLTASGVDAQYIPLRAAEVLNARWLAAVSRGRPYVIAKWAATLDGRTAAADGTSFWITGEAARDHAHGVRATVDAIVVGTSTVIIDNPELSARPPDNFDAHQPLRVVMGLRDTSAAKVWRNDNAVAARTHDPHEVLELLHERDVRTVLVEGGSTITSAFLREGLVDEVHAYIAPAILGSGPTAVQNAGIDTMSAALRGEHVTITPLGVDVLVTVLLTEGT
jgi:diaminohydroxyphosphoribosylaminopyrimidine deaminase/5-amino-6-(5-phosphoribosylamino)uracil reductase